LQAGSRLLVGAVLGGWVGGWLVFGWVVGEGEPIVGYREVPARNARKKGLLFGEYAELLPNTASA
jgi:hypothetical protein